MKTFKIPPSFFVTAVGMSVLQSESMMNRSVRHTCSTFN